MFCAERTRHVLCGLVAAAFCASSSSWAGGFYVPQKDASGIGLATAGDSARATDPSTVYFNPAGMTRLGGRMLQWSLNVLTPTVDIRNEGSTATTPGTGGAPASYAGQNGEAGVPTPAANLFYAQPLGSKDLWVGVALTSPFGLALDYGNDWFGRYDSINSILLTSNIAPSVAYRISESLSIGAGLDVQYAHLHVTNAIPNTLGPGAPDPSTDGRAVLKGDSWAVGFNVGLLLTPWPQTRIGVHYRSGITHDFKGSLTVSHLPGPLAPVNGRTNSRVEIRLPAIASLGIAQDVGRDLTLLGEVQWFEWSRFNEVKTRFDNGTPDLVRPQGYRNSRSLAFGAEYRLNPQWKMRAGARVEKTPTVDETRNTSVPDSNLKWIGGGARYQYSKALAFDVGVVYADFQAARINLPLVFFPGTPVAGSVNVRGNTGGSSVTTVAGSVSWNF